MPLELTLLLKRAVNTVEITVLFESGVIGATGSVKKLSPKKTNMSCIFLSLMLFHPLLGVSVKQ